MRIPATMVALAALVLPNAPASAAPAANPAVVDPARDPAFPAHNQQLLIPSHGVGMNALLLVTGGKGPHPTVILMHGLPGNERNLDLAQAIRRAGWDVLTFTYRGAWGSPGDFSIANAMEDTAAALEFARSADGARFGIDTRNIVLAGHSMGGATAFMTAASATGLDGLILIDAWNIAGQNKPRRRHARGAGQGLRRLRQLAPRRNARKCRRRSDRQTRAMEPCRCRTAPFQPADSDRHGEIRLGRGKRSDHGRDPTIW